MINLYNLKESSIIKKMSLRELKDLAQQCREIIINSTAKNGGHLSPNLGSVESIISMHYVFDPKKDFFYFDIGHQAYVHKFLTGRAKMFENLRHEGGAEAFLKKYESKYDIYEGGRSSTALSASLGHALAKKILNKNYNIVSYIGDASFQNGIAFEFMNNVSKFNSKTIVVLNNNRMSISKDVGGSIEMILNKIVESDLNKYLGKDKKPIFKYLYKKANDIKNPFRIWNIDYIGPIDGNDLLQMIETYKYVKLLKNSVVIHISTHKGRGLSYAEKDDKGLYHGVPANYNIENGEFPKSETIKKAKVNSMAIACHMKSNPNLILLTAAMGAPTYSDLLSFKKHYPNRVYDIGINEELQALMGLGLRNGKMIPYMEYYSAFISRAYDQLIHDITRARSSAIFTMNDSGFAPSSGDTHHTLYDFSMVLGLPNTIVAAPGTCKEIYDVMKTFLINSKKTINAHFVISSPVQIPYDINKNYTGTKLDIGKWSIYHKSKNPIAYIISYDYNLSLIKDFAEKNNINVTIINALFIKPIDIDMLIELLSTKKRIFVYEDKYWANGLGSFILSSLNHLNIKTNDNIKVVGAKLEYYRTASLEKLKIQANVSLNDLFSLI